MALTDDVGAKADNIHVAIVPDGNRRWAQARGRPEWAGHMAGAKKLKEVADWCWEHPEIKTVSIYALSTENLNRSVAELGRLWGIYHDEFRRILKAREVAERGLRINVIGNSAVWRPDVRAAAAEVMAATKNYTRGVLNILLAYGSQFEITSSVKKIIQAGVRRMPLVPAMLNKFLMVSQPVDLLIRTGGEHRLSNFLLWQAAYAEIYFSDTLWPDFSRAEFERILKWYRDRNRRMGL